MLLISPQRAALALGTQCQNPSGVGEEALLEQLRLLTPRIEGALDVATLSRVTTVDRFLPKALSDHRLPLRLSNGFVVPTGITFAGLLTSEGEALVTPDFIDHRLGALDLGAYDVDTSSAVVSVRYTSGFTIPAEGGGVHPDENYRVAEGVPDWLSALVVSALTQYRRNATQKSTAPDTYGFLPTLNEAVLRLIKAQLYSHYQRPRASHHWAIHSALAT